MIGLGVSHSLESLAVSYLHLSIILVMSLLLKSIKSGSMQLWLSLGLYSPSCFSRNVSLKVKVCVSESSNMVSWMVFCSGITSIIVTLSDTFTAFCRYFPPSGRRSDKPRQLAQNATVMTIGHGYGAAPITETAELPIAPIVKISCMTDANETGLTCISMTTKRELYMPPMPPIAKKSVK